jgi:glycosyltransferase involved in cell wall biosynthesis
VLVPEPQAMPRLLFISPAYPDTQGSRLAMRAGVFIEALAQTHHITLLVVPVSGKATPTSETLVERCCKRLVVVDPGDGGDTMRKIARRVDNRPASMRLFARQRRAVKAALRGQTFEVIHAYRFDTVPLAIGLAASAPPGDRPAIHVDLDDVESTTHRRLAELYEMNGRAEEAGIERAEAGRYETEETKLLFSFQRIYVCSSEAAEWLEFRTVASIRVVPNAVRPPTRSVWPVTTRPFTFLFVGSLNLYWNEDAVLFLYREVLPRLRSVTQSPFRVRIAGPGAPPALRPLARSQEVRFAGAVPDISREYAAADAVIVPVRAGRGAHIKVLEAFIHRRPVVATGAGVEGIDVTPEEHCLLADSAGALATHCLRLMRNPDLGTRLSDKAYEFVSSRYAPDNARRAIVGDAWLPPRPGIRSGGLPRPA